MSSPRRPRVQRGPKRKTVAKAKNGKEEKAKKEDGKEEDKKKDKKKKRLMGVIALKLGRPFGMTEHRLLKHLRLIQGEYGMGRNAACSHWYHWRTHIRPDWQVGAAYTPIPSKQKRKPKPVDPDKPVKKESPIAPDLFLSREMYAAAAKVMPHAAGKIRSAASQSVQDRLRTKTPWNHPGKGRFVWQAILRHETAIPSWGMNREIPLPRQDMLFGYDGKAVAQITGGGRPILSTARGREADVLRAAQHGCVVGFPLLADGCGYTVTSPIVRLEMSELSEGEKAILRKMAAGTLRISDSQLVEDKKDKWFLHLCYDRIPKASNLPRNRIMTIQPSLPGDMMPFLASWTSEETGEKAKWFLGKAQPYIAGYQRLVSRRRTIQQGYKTGTGRGKGRRRFHKAVSVLARQIPAIQVTFRKLTVADIIKKAIRERCGKIIYREPDMYIRERSWFTVPDVPFAWTDFESRLRTHAAAICLEYEKARIGYKEWMPPERRKKAS